MRALIVDDSPTVRREVGRMAADLGFEVYEAVHGADAMDMMRKLGPVELVVLDWHMPHTDGLWFLRELRKEAAFGEVLVVMATSNSQLDGVRQALVEGANEYMMKPFTREDLEGKLQILGFQFQQAES
ncbi:MAG TPA: response regulator [Anaeromyxobacteraceae bacterium]|nr:response regulator [Anaeromyxobacteraceae bacterium]